MYIDEQSGIYLVNEQHSISFLMYKKLSPQELKSALPLSYHPRKGNYILCVYTEYDFIGQTTFDNIINCIENCKNHIIHLKSDIKTISKWMITRNKVPFTKSEIDALIQSFGF